MKTYEIHPYAHIWAITSEWDYEALKTSIKEIGQEEPALVLDGRIIDGRNRYKVCQELGLELKVLNLEDAKGTQAGKALLDKVLAYNTRRNVTAGQKAVEAVLLQQAYAKEGEPKEDREMYALRGVSKPDFQSAKWLLKHKPHLKDSALAGEALPLPNDKTTKSLQTFVKAWKEYQATVIAKARINEDDYDIESMTQHLDEQRRKRIFGMFFKLAPKGVGIEQLQKNLVKFLIDNDHLLTEVMSLEQNSFKTNQSNSSQG